MKFKVAAVLVATASAVAVFPAGAAQATTPPKSSTSGLITYINAGGTPVALALYADQQGGAVGYYGTAGTLFAGIVTCYVQQGNMARFSGKIVYGNRSGFFRGTVIDNGATGDLVRFGFRSATTPYDCAQPYAALRPLTRGDVRVVGSNTTSPNVLPGLAPSAEVTYPDEQE